MSFFSTPYFPGIVSFLTCVVIIPLVIKLAFHQNWVVEPKEDRWHQKPTALMGGAGIFISYSIALFISGFEQINWIIYAASALMFLTGLIDDLIEIKPIIKLVVQVICSFALLYHGFYFGGGLLGWAGIPLTFIWVIGITNAINLLDNMDGLAAGISAIIAIIAGILGILNGELIIASMAFALAGAALGFLVYNFKPARIFMGDSGSLFLGFSLSFLSVAIQGNLGSSSSILVLLIPISLMIIPIMDTTLVTVKRIIADRRIDQGGKDHTSHRMVALGLTERNAVLILYLISAVWGLLCILALRVQINNLFVCVLLLAIFSVIFSVFLSNVRVYNETEEKLTSLRLRGRKEGNRFSFLLFLFHKKLIVGICTDILIIYGSFLLATNSMGLHIDEDYVVLGAFICVKVSVFYFSNLYYRMLRYIAIIELAGYFGSALASTVILGVILFLKDRSGDYPFYFLMIDFLLTFTGMLFSRMVYRWLIELVNKSRQFQKKVIIYGAGDSGYLLIRELLQNRAHELEPIGWIDDDPSKHNMYLYGFKIYGGEEQLLKICKDTNAEIILISSNTIDNAMEERLRSLLAPHDIELGRFSMNLYFN